MPSELQSEPTTMLLVEDNEFARESIAAQLTYLGYRVPKGMSGTINGFMNKDSVRGTSVCFEEVTGATISGSKFTIDGKLIAAENPVIFKPGDPMRMEGDASTGEFNYSLRGGGKDNSFDMKGVVLIS